MTTPSTASLRRSSASLRLASVWAMIVAGTTIIGAARAEERSAKPWIIASWAGYDVMESLVREFQNARGIRLGEVDVCDANQVIKQMQGSETLLAVVQDGMVPRSQKDLYLPLKGSRLGSVCVGVITNSQGGIRSLTVDELGLVFRGRISDWERVKGASLRGPIELFGLVDTTTESIVMRVKCMDGHLFRDDYLHLPWPEDGHIIRQKVKPSAVVEAVATDRQAIGFISWHPGSELLDKRVTLVQIARQQGSSGTVPSEETISDGSYPLIDTLTLFLPQNPPAVVREFVEFATGLEGAKIVKKHGLWLEYELEQVRAKRRLADMRAGKGTPVDVIGLAASEGLIKSLVPRFVEAKQVVQMKYRKHNSPDEAVAKFFQAGSELLLLDRTPDEAGSASLSAASNTVPIGKAALGVIVHPDSTLTALPIEELQQICSGEIKNWPWAVERKPSPPTPLPRAGEGSGTPIRGYGLQSSDPVMRIYRDMLAAKGAARAGHGLKLTASSDTQKVILAVARDPAVRRRRRLASWRR